MTTKVRHQTRWLEGVLIFVTAGLVLQLVPPSWWWGFLELVDVRNWSRGTWWIATNFLLLSGLAGLEYSSDVKRARLRVLLGLVLLALVFQIFPSLWYGLLALLGALGTFLVWLLKAIPPALGKLWQTFVTIVDVRHWSQVNWFVANGLLVLILIVVRAVQHFKPNLNFKEVWRARQARLAAKREEQERIRHTKESHEMRERIEAGRRRRMY